MGALVEILDSYGYALLFMVGFAEFAGLPIAAVPALIAAGALARAGGLSLPMIAGAAALGGLLADAVWYGAARRSGGRLVGVACALSPNRGACIGTVERQVERLGPRYILFAKFLPGVGNLIAAAAGYAAVPVRRFLSLDAAGLLVWALVWAGLGWLFSDQVETLIATAAEYTRWLLWGLLLLVATGAGFRLWKFQAHRELHAPDPENPPGAG